MGAGNGCAVEVEACGLVLVAGAARLESICAEAFEARSTPASVDGALPSLPSDDVRAGTGRAPTGLTTAGRTGSVGLTIAVDGVDRDGELGLVEVVRFCEAVFAFSRAVGHAFAMAVARAAAVAGAAAGVRAGVAAALVVAVAVAGRDPPYSTA